MQTENHVVPQMAFRPKSLIEERLTISQYGNAAFDIILSLINNEGDEDATNCCYEVQLSDYVRFNGGKRAKDLYPKLRQGFDEIYRKSIAYGDADMGGEFHIIAELAWDSKKMALSFVLSPTTKGMLLTEKQKRINAFYSWRYTLSMSGKYTNTLYYLCKEWEWQSYGEKRGTHKETLDRLNYILGIPTSYKTSNVMGLLNTCIDEINKYSDIHVTLKVNRTSVQGGEKIDSVTFTIDRNFKTSDNEIRNLKGFIETELAEQGIETDRRTPIEMAELAIGSGIGEDDIRKRIRTVKEKKDKIQNMPGFLRFIMGRDYEDSAENGTKQPKSKSVFCSINQQQDDFDLALLINNNG